MKVLIASMLLISLSLTCCYAQLRLTTQSDLSDRTFIIDEEGEVNKTGDDLHLLLLFRRNGSAIFRSKRGNKIIKDNPLSWQLIGDSLYLQQGSISIIADGKTESIVRELMKYAIVKKPKGYLLKEKHSQMLLFEMK